MHGDRHFVYVSGHFVYVSGHFMCMYRDRQRLIVTNNRVLQYTCSTFVYIVVAMSII